MSSPSTPPVRGNTSSSSPISTTTRCGTERIGTIVHTVSSPVRKLARVGLPARLRESIARTSARRNTVSPPNSTAATSSRWAPALCQESAGAVSVSRSRARISTRSHSAGECGPARSRSETARRSTNSAKRPVRSMSVPSTSSSGSARSNQAFSDSSALTPNKIRSMAVLKVFCGNASRPNVARCRLPIPQRAPASVVHSRSLSNSSSPHEKRVRTGSVAARSRTSLAVARPSANSRREPRTARTGLV